jgi:PAS domain S-box-containing protein
MKTLLSGNDDSTLEAMQLRLRERGLVVVRRREIVAPAPMPAVPAAAEFQLAILVAIGDGGRPALHAVQAFRQLPGGDAAVVLIVVDEQDPAIYEQLVDAGASDFLVWPRDSELVPARLAALEERARQRRRERSTTREAEALHQGVLERAPVMMYTTDGEGRLTSVSDRWCEVLGYGRGEVLGRMSLAFQSEAGRLRVVEELLPVLVDKGEVRDVPHELVGKDGQTVSLRLSAVAERDESGQLERSIVVLLPTGGPFEATR